MKEYTLQDLQAISALLLGYGKNGKPRALWDIVVEGSKIADGGKKKKNKRHHKKKKHKTSKSLMDFYQNAFDVNKMDW